MIQRYSNMNSSLIKYTISLVFLLSVFTADAQDSTTTSALVGVWQLDKIALSSRTDVMNPESPTLKVFDSNGTLSQVVVSDKGAFILQKGKFELVDSTHFNDIIWTDSRPDFKRAGIKNLIEYHITKNGTNTFLSLVGWFENEKGEKTVNWKELWRKVEVIPK
ncbi:hypothetical protein ABIB40_001150 [Pedobacter sp. UYP30]|uniref:DUF4488 domain-containing protein n=1 Tax=Pedobacter sp. UYP30 TaxID=1756400 RepID=UPI0033955AC4